jgi:hypothetical protein
MRAVVTAAMMALVVAVVVRGAAGCADDDEGATRPPAAVATPAPPRRTAAQIKDCRDQCEQTQLVAGQADDAGLRGCRARCAGGSGVGVGGPHEVPRSITRSPSLSSPPPVRPIQPSR